MSQRRNPFDQFMAEGDKFSAPFKLVLRLVRRNTSPTEPQVGRQQKFRELFASNSTWGSIGLLAGSINNPWALPFMLVSCIVMLVTVWWVNFFKGPSRFVEIFANSFLSALLILAYVGLWYILPHPVKPLSFSEQARALMGELCKQQPKRFCTDEQPTPPPAPATSSSEVASAFLKLMPKQSNLADSLSNSSLSTLGMDVSKRLEHDLDDLLGADSRIESKFMSANREDQQRMRPQEESDRASIRKVFLRNSKPRIVEANEIRNTLLERLGRKKDVRSDDSLTVSFNWGAYLDLVKELRNLSTELK